MNTFCRCSEVEMDRSNGEAVVETRRQRDPVHILGLAEHQILIVSSRSQPQLGSWRQLRHVRDSATSFKLLSSGPSLPHFHPALWTSALLHVCAHRQSDPQISQRARNEQADMSTNTSNAHFAQPGSDPDASYEFEEAPAPENPDDSSLPPAASKNTDAVDKGGLARVSA